MNRITRASEQSGGGGEAAKALEERGLRPSFEPGLGEPGRELGDFGFGHGRDHSRCAKRKANARGTPTLAPVLWAP